MKTNFFNSVESFKGYESSYSESAFWQKIGICALKAGRTVVKYALTLYYVMKEESTPIKDKLLIISALGYLILPIDLIPDLMPVLGFTDDLSALIFCYKKVKGNVTAEIEQKVEERLSELF